MKKFKKDNKATNRQVGGDHYRSLKITPTQYIYANDLSWNLGNCVKYITRNKEDKVEDLLKAKHYIGRSGVNPSYIEVGILENQEGK